MLLSARRDAPPPLSGGVLLLVAILWLLYAIIFYWGFGIPMPHRPIPMRERIEPVVVVNQPVSKFNLSVLSTECFSSDTEHPSSIGNRFYAVNRSCAESKKKYDDEIPSHFYSIVCNSYNRPEFLSESIRHYRQCKGLGAYYVIWCSGQKQEPPGHLFSTSLKPPAILIRRNNSLNERFRPIDGWNSDHAVLSIDDDILIPCHEVWAMFTAYQGAQPPLALCTQIPHIPSTEDEDRMVGPFSRAVSCQQQPKVSKEMPDLTLRYDYHSGATQQHVEHLGYRLVLTKFAFFHFRFLDMYTHQDKRTLAMVDARMNCEDIVMSWRHFQATRKTAVWTPNSSARVLHAANAISGKRGHGSTREYATPRRKRGVLSIKLISLRSLCLALLQMWSGESDLQLGLSKTKIPTCIASNL